MTYIFFVRQLLLPAERKKVLYVIIHHGQPWKKIAVKKVAYLLEFLYTSISIKFAPVNHVS